MSDKRDGKSNRPPDAGQEYSVEDILTEFSSARSNGRVVQFPAPPNQEPPEDEAPPSKPRKADKTAQIIDLPSGNPAFEVTQKLKGLVSQVERYADQMYRNAEPTPEQRRAERYIPGVDVEREPPPSARSRPRKKKPRPAPEDVPPALLAQRRAKGLSGARLRRRTAFVLSLLCLWLSLALPLPDLVPSLGAYRLHLYACAAVLALTAALCYDVVWTGLRDFFSAKPGAESLCALSALFTLADALTMPMTGTREETLPCAAPACFVLVFALWGRWYKQRGEQLSCRTAAQAKRPYIVTLDEAKWSGRPAFCKWSGTLRGFGSQIQMPDGTQQVYRVAAPLLIVAGLMCALLSSAGRGAPEHFLWAASAGFTAASSLSALMAYGLPFHVLARRLSKTGAALAGWAGAERCRDGSIVLTDTDLFPPGTVRHNGIKVFGNFPNEKVVAYTATLIRSTGGGLDKPFSDLMKAENALYRTAGDVSIQENGITGVIRGQEVLVGTASFMRLMNVALPQGLSVKNAVFCAIDGDLAGVFALRYELPGAVQPCLTALIHNRITPLLATRDPNLIPSLLGQKFKLPVDKLEFPSVERRLELSQEDGEHDAVVTAALCREGLEPYCDAAVGARRLCTAVWWGTILSVAGGCVGLLLTFYLTFVDAYHSLSPAALLVFLLGWLVPELVLADWVNRY